MSAPIGSNSHAAHENFANFFESWLAVQYRDLQSLLAAASHGTRNCEEEAAQDHRVRRLNAAVLGHYERYYRTKKASAHHDVLPMFTPTWASSTENLFHWIGGWRPTMAFQLLYSKCGMQVESRLAELIRGVSTRDLADIDAEQLRRIDELHRRTVKQEREISEEEAAAQETVADAQLLGLSHTLTEMGGGGDGEEMMEAEMKGKREAMVKVLEKADGLRIETLKGIVEILRSMQAAHFLIAAAELHLQVHEFGMRKDAVAKTGASSTATSTATATATATAAFELRGDRDGDGGGGF